MKNRQNFEQKNPIKKSDGKMMEKNDGNGHAQNAWKNKIKYQIFIARHHRILPYALFRVLESFYQILIPALNTKT